MEHISNTIDAHNYKEMPRCGFRNTLNFPKGVTGRGRDGYGRFFKRGQGEWVKAVVGGEGLEGKE